MPQQYSGRIAVILLVLFGSLAIIFSPVLEKLFHPHEQVTQWIKLKPGIDMVGGTSLVYQIKTAPGTRGDTQLATKVATALKRRVDPNGVMNLIWRPQGADRLEIQMPNTGASSSEARDKREQLLAVEQQLQKTNVSLSEVIDAVEGRNGKTRADLQKLSDGSKARLDLFNQMGQVFDQIQAIHNKPAQKLH